MSEYEELEARAGGAHFSDLSVAEKKKLYLHAKNIFKSRCAWTKSRDGEIKVRPTDRPSDRPGWMDGLPHD